VSGGAQGTDPDFPYTGGVIGVWGYNIIDKTFISPTKGKDMMGYCPNEWVSDYTFTALFDRIAAVNGGTASAGGGGGSGAGGNLQARVATPSQSAVSAGAKQTFRTATVEGDGSVAWGGDFELDDEPTDGEARAVAFLSPAGQTIGTQTARFYRYDHIPGGVLVVPTAPRALAQTNSAHLQAAWSQVRISGVANALAR